MLKTNFKIAWRNLFSNKIYSLINITGLTVGLTSCLLVSTVVVDELSYDKQWKNTDRVYRLISTTSLQNAEERTASTFTAFGPELKRNFPEIKEYCRLQVEESRLKFDQQKDGILCSSLSTENSIFKVFDFSILQGNPTEFISGYDNVIITQKIKEEYFPDEDPIGMIIEDVSNNFSNKCIITGVIKDIPGNTHLRAEVLVLKKFLNDPGLNRLTNGFGIKLMPQYLLLEPGTNRAQFTQKINHWYKKQDKEIELRRSLDLQPLKDVYLRSDFNEQSEDRGSITTIYILIGVSVLLLLIACINYINLTTARTLKRMRNIGVYKILGAGRMQLIKQFLCESLLFFIISFALSNSIYAVSIQSLESYLGHQLELTLFTSTTLYATAFCILLIVCVFTGLYPAYLLSRFKPLNTIRGTLTTQIGGLQLRKALITLQFIIAIAVLVAAIVVHLQLNLLNNKNIGYDKKNLLKVDFTLWGTTGNTFKKELLKVPGVEQASISTWFPSGFGGIMASEEKDPENENTTIRVNYIEADPDFAATLKLKLQSGRFFNPTISTDLVRDSSGYRNILMSDNYAKVFAVRELNKPIVKSRTIPVGIVKDFHNETLLEKEKPFTLIARDDIQYGAMLIRTREGSGEAVIKALSSLFRKFYPKQTLSFSWAEDLLEKQYRAESKLNTLFILFTLLTVFLACLGLFGLVTFTVEQRTKEIGIRKVLGAGILTIVSLVSKDFLKLVFVAILIASPVSWYLMSEWLQDYVYRIAINWQIFGLAGTLVIIVAVLTIGFQSAKAAVANPVKSLRSE